MHIVLGSRTEGVWIISIVSLGLICHIIQITVDSGCTSKDNTVC